MSTHDGLVLLAIYVGVIGAGALIEYVEHRVKRAIRRRKRSWKTSLFFLKKTLDILRGVWYYNIRKGKENPEHQKGWLWIITRSITRSSWRCARLTSFARVRPGTSGQTAKALPIAWWSGKNHFSRESSLAVCVAWRIGAIKAPILSWKKFLTNLKSMV